MFESHEGPHIGSTAADALYALHVVRVNAEVAVSARRQYIVTNNNSRLTITTRQVNNVVMTTTSVASRSPTTITIATVAMATTTAARRSISSRRASRRTTTSRAKFDEVGRRSRPTSCTSSSERSTRLSTRTYLLARSWHSGWTLARHEYRSADVSAFHTTVVDVCVCGDQTHTSTCPAIFFDAV